MTTTLNQRLLKMNKTFKAFTKTTYMPTGSLIMDTVMGGGLPVGKVIELASDAGAGKTTITLSMCRELLAAGKKVIYLDHEGAVTTSQLEGIFGTDGDGIPFIDKWLWTEDNPDGLFFLFQVMTYSDAEKVLDNLLGSGEFSLVVIDSVTAMVADEYLMDVENPEANEGKDVTDMRPAVDARLLGKFLKKFKAVCTKYDVTMILINQLRTNLNITGMGMSTKISTGGAAIEFFPDIRLRLEKPQPVYQNKKNNLTGEVEKQQIGCTASIYAYKNKLAPGKIKVPITIVYGKGISNLYSYLSWLPNKKVMYDGEEIPMLVKKGGGYNTLTLKSGQQFTVRGDDALEALVREHFQEIRSCFGPEDFEITENKAFAEFAEDGTNTFEQIPDEPFEKENEGIPVEGWDEEE